jgi:hypothetical protein
MSLRTRIRDWLLRPTACEVAEAKALNDLVMKSAISALANLRLLKSTKSARASTSMPTNPSLDSE